MTTTDLLVDAFERIRDAVHPAVNGLSLEELAFRPDAESNSIAWLVWHLTRIQDDRVAGLDSREQVWTAQGWSDRFGLPLDPLDTGYGHDPTTVAAVIADAPSLLGYFEDVHAKTLGFVRSLDRRRPRPGGGPNLGPTGDGEYPTGERHRRRPPARGSSCLCPGDHPAPVTQPARRSRGQKWVRR